MARLQIVAALAFAALFLFQAHAQMLHLRRGRRAAVVGRTRRNGECAAQELAPFGVRVNALSPIARTRLIEKAPQEIQEMMAAREGYDPFAPDHAARLLLCLCLPDARFTGRLLGCLGDEVYLYRPWSADYRIDNGGAPWTLAALETELGTLPQQDICWMMTADGLVEQVLPPTTLG